MKGQAMTMEYAGAVEIAPPFRAGAQDWVRGSAWTPSRDGQTIRPRADVTLEDCVGSLRDLVTLDAGERTYLGVVAAYDPDTGAMVAVSVRDGRVSRRVIGKPRARPESNVIDLATHRRSASRRIS
ncbi:MAG TPA: hypothetical protein VHR85_07760 [Nocardioides sp.]|jgi:hypothetical protein|nr:hypothetical protein [Nocardioides sp.]